MSKKNLQEGSKGSGPWPVPRKRKSQETPGRNKIDLARGSASMSLNLLVVRSEESGAVEAKRIQSSFVRNGGDGLLTERGVFMRKWQPVGATLNPGPDLLGKVWQVWNPKDILCVWPPVTSNNGLGSLAFFLESPSPMNHNNRLEGKSDAFLIGSRDVVLAASAHVCHRFGPSRKKALKGGGP
jgi:hypothetical protein